jgi:hypothetical protein
MSVVKNNRGVSIVAVVIMMLILAAMGTALVSLVGSENDASVKQMKSSQAQYIAEGGMEYILASPRVFPNYSTNGAAVSLGAGSFQTDTPAYLTAPVSIGNTTITVNSTTGFANAGRIVIDSEVIAYTGTTATTFTGAGPAAAAHASGNSVYPVTTVTADPGAGGTTIAANSTAGFVIAGVVKIGSEYIYCTGATGTTFTSCTRGYRGTTAAAHAIGSNVFQYAVTSTGTVSGAFGSAQRVVKASVDGTSSAGIAFDAASSASSSGSGSASLTWSHTVSVSGTNRILIVGVSVKSGSTVTGVSYAGVSFSAISNPIVVGNNAGNARVELWQLVAPATGANNVIVTLSASARFVGGAVSLTGVNQTNPIDASNSASGSSATPSITITTIANNAWVVDTIASSPPTSGANPTGGQTQQWNVATGGAGSAVQILGAGSTLGPITPSGAVVESWSLGGSSSWAIAASSLKPVTATVSALDWREIFP